MHVSEFQRRAVATDHIPSKVSPKWLYASIGLQGQIGSLADCCKKRLTENQSYMTWKEDARIRIGQVAWYLATLTSHIGEDLEEILAENLERNEARWPRKSVTGKIFENKPPRPFDETYSELERLPRRFTLRFECSAVQKGGVQLEKVAVTHVETGKAFGDRIDDNSYDDDGYRFHDVIHAAYVVYLGWSPVFRKLLACKRKSIPDIDRIEDGARARDTEEAITRIIHAYAQQSNMFRGLDSVDTKLLQAIKFLSAGLEVDACDVIHWQTAILAGYQVRDEVLKHQGGFVLGDLQARKLSFSKEVPLNDG